MSIKKVLKDVLFAVTLGIVASQSALATVKHVYAENRTYTRGEVLWVGPMKTINQSLTLTYKQVENEISSNGGKDSGAMGIAPNNEAFSVGQNIGNFEMPVLYNNVGYDLNVAWTLIGELTATNPLETVKWKQDRWSLPSNVGKKQTIEFQPVTATTNEGLAAGKMRTFLSLFDSQKTPITLELHGYVQVAVFCNAATCQVPTHKVDINQTSVGLSYGILPGTGVIQTQAVIDDYYELYFNGVEACTYRMNPTEHTYEIPLKVGTKGALLSSEQPKSSTFTVSCGAGNKERRAYVLLGGPTLVNNRKLVATNLRGIGIAYNDKTVTDCSNNLEYETKIPVGSWTAIKLDGKEYIAKKTFHFGICQYEDAANVERGELRGSVQYTHWLE